jgi:uncharacterized phage protein gp47/JayE
MFLERSLTEVIQSIISNIHDAKPGADTKEGTFIRDVFINPVADEITALYGDMQLVLLSQSIVTASGADLDALAQNYFVTRKSATYSYGKVRYYIKNTDKPLSALKDSDLPSELYIPNGSIVSTTPTFAKDAIQFKITESIYETRESILALPLDSDYGLRFIEVAAVSVDMSSGVNIGAGEITQQVSDTNSAIAMITNPFAFTGGTDAEDDPSLALRIQLAVSGANIGTKNGYLGYTLKQSGVIDATVVGAGDKIMYRDGGHDDATGKYIFGKGGMVDIWVRGSLDSEQDWNFTLTNDYVYGGRPYSDIVLPRQPVNKIISVQSSAGKTYINADLYEIEKSTHKDGEGNTITEVLYYQDIPWDFSVTDTFPDADYYPLPIDLTLSQIQALKAQVDTELKNALAYMSNINYSINWYLCDKKASSGDLNTDIQNGIKTALFDKYFYTDNNVYKIVSWDPRLNGRVFIKKNDTIYVRTYGQPDFTLNKDISPTGYSVTAKDSLKWLNGERPFVNETITIRFNYDQLINDLQQGIETKRVLTADVLMKQAQKVSIEIIVDALCFPEYDPSNVKIKIANALTNYINNLKNMGGVFDRSDIVTTVRQVDGVDAVNIDTIQISVKGGSPQKRIEAAANQYLLLENIILNVYSDDRIIM